MNKVLAVIVCGLLFFSKAKSETVTADSFNVAACADSVFLELKQEEQFSNPTSFSQRTKGKVRENKKLMAALCAFPLPLGIVGGHRIYMGSKPYIPLIYIATLGGCFGILPLIDFVVILCTKEEDLAKFENNSAVFMWAK